MRTRPIPLTLLAHSFAILALGAAGAAHAQAPAPAPQGDAAACAGAWPVCGPNRVLDEAEIRNSLFRSGQATRIDMTGGTSGRAFVMVLKPDSRLDVTSSGTGNFGREWTLDNGKLCLRLSQNLWQGQFNCGHLEIREGKLYWRDNMDASDNLITAVSFSRP